MTNLPPGTTPADIDKHFGGEEVVLTADVSVSVRATAFESDSEDRKEEKLLEAVENGDWDEINEVYILDEQRK